MEQWPPSEPDLPADGLPGDEEEPWDEDRWEQFLREGDRRSEEYMALLNMFGDEPDGHNIIARAMGWDHLVTYCGRPPDEKQCHGCRDGWRCPFHQNVDWVDGLEDGPESQSEAGLAGAEEAADASAIFSRQQAAQEGPEDPWADRREHPLIRSAGRLLFDAYEWVGEEPPAAIARPARRMHNHLAACCGQLAAALGDDDFSLDVVGLTIAYLKRAFKSICLALGALSEIRQTAAVSPRRCAEVQARMADLRRETEAQIRHFRRAFRTGSGP